MISSNFYHSNNKKTIPKFSWHLTTEEYEPLQVASTTAREFYGQDKDEIVPFEFDSLPDSTITDRIPFRIRRLRDRKLEIQIYAGGIIKSHCSCVFFTSMVMPCRHWYGIAFIHPEVSSAAFELVHMTWRKEFIRHRLDTIAERRTSVLCQAVNVIGRRIVEEAKPELACRRKIFWNWFKLDSVISSSVGGRIVSSPDWEALPFSWRWLLASMRRTHCGGPYR